MCYYKLFFICLNPNICCGYSKEPSQWDGSFEHPKQMFEPMDKKIFIILRPKFLFTWNYGNMYDLQFYQHHSYYRQSFQFFTCCVGWTGPFLPISRGQISAPFPIKNSHLFSQYHVWFAQLRKVKYFFFFFFFSITFFKDPYYLWETLTHIRVILKYLCLSGMLCIIQSKITWFWGYILLPL